MRNIWFILFLFTCCVSAYSQVTIFTENMGSPGGTTAIAANTFQNSGTYTYAGSADCRSTLPSTGYTGASGSGNVFFTNTAGTFFEMSGINTSGYSSLVLSFGHYKSTNASNNELSVEVSADGITYTSLSYSRTTGPGTSNWLLITPSGTIPSTTNLRIRFTQTITNNWRIDDIKLTGVLTLGVGLVAFAAETSSRTNVLSWSTESEKNADYFSVQRAGEDGKFAEIGKVSCFGNTTVAQHYQFRDENPVNGINYYRLQEFDFDMASQFSDVISIRNNASPAGVFYNNSLHRLTFPQDLLEGTNVEIIAASRNLSHKVFVDMRVNTVSADQLPAGIYLIRYTTVDGKVNTAKVPVL